MEAGIGSITDLERLLAEFRPCGKQVFFGLTNAFPCMEFENARDERGKVVHPTRCAMLRKEALFTKEGRQIDKPHWTLSASDSDCDPVSYVVAHAKGISADVDIIISPEFFSDEIKEQSIRPFPTEIVAEIKRHIEELNQKKIEVR